MGSPESLAVESGCLFDERNLSQCELPLNRRTRT